MRSDRLARTLFVAAVLFLVFLAGFAASHFKVFPHRYLSKALNQGTAFFEERADAHAMHPPRHDFAGARAWDGRGPIEPKAIAAKPGEYVLLSSYWPECEWRPGLRLIDQTGKIAHTWDSREAVEIWPGRSSLLDRLATFNYIHGSHLFENGDVLMNIEYIGLVRMDAAGRVVWKLDRQTHHSVHQAENGNFWVCESRMIEFQDEVSARFQGLLAPLVEDRVIEVTPAGEVVSEISILELLYRSEQRNRLLSYPVGTNRSWDILHLNDVEPLPARMAPQYPGFAAGDLLVSMRDISTVLVFDRTTKRIKWTLAAQTLRQHDPDFIGGGWISVYDNNSDETPAGEKLGGSRIVAFKPETGERREIYPPPPSSSGLSTRTSSGHERPFYSLLGGKAQLLADGHWLITEATGARVFEVDSDGTTVWEWAHERHGPKGHVSEVLEGTRYDLDPETVRKWPRP